MTSIELLFANKYGDRRNWPRCSRLRAVVILLAIFAIVNSVWYLFNNSNRIVMMQSIEGQEQSWSASVPLVNASEYLAQRELQMQQMARIVTTTDQQLRQLARCYTDQQFVHPNANLSNTHKLTGPAMNSIREIASVTDDVLIDIKNPCSGTGGRNQTVVVFLFCSPGDWHRRHAIRETYGKALKQFSQTEIYFVVGSSNDITHTSQLVAESQMHGDILQFAFHDNYYNLTLKSIAMLRWTALHCPRTKFIFKLDYDCFIRVNPFLQQLQALPADTMFGLYRTVEPVLNTPDDQYSKWYIDPLRYPYTSYPPYIAGPYLIPGQRAAALYEAIITQPTVDTIPALPFDDVYITGLLAEKVAIPRSHFDGLLMLAGVDLSNMWNLQEHTVFFEALDDIKLWYLWQFFGVN